MRDAFTRSLFICSLLLLISFFLISTVCADDDVKKVKLRKISGAYEGSNAVQTSKDSYVTFCLHGKNKMAPFTLSSVRFTSKAKAYPAKHFFNNIAFNQMISGNLPGLSAIGFNDFSASGTGPAADAAGMVLLSTMSPDFTKLITQAVKFDPKGARMGSNIRLPDITIPGNSLRNINVTAAKGTDSIGIAIAASAFVQNTRAYVFFMEIDFDGNVIRGPVQLKLLNNGTLQQISVGVPYFNGKNWWIPADTVNTTIKNFVEVATSHSLVVISATPKNNTYASKTVKFADDNQETPERTFAGYQFYSYHKQKKSSPTPSAKPKYYLFYSAREIIKGPEQTFVPAYYIQETKKGKTKGNRVEAQIPEWKPKLDTVSALWEVTVLSESFSNIVVTDKGNVLIGIQRSLETFAGSPAGSRKILPGMPKLGLYHNATWVINNRGEVRFNYEISYDANDYAVQDCPPMLNPFIVQDMFLSIFFAQDVSENTYMWMQSKGIKP